MRLARQDVVCGEHERPPAREQPAIELLDGEPLEVHDLRGAGGAPVAQHVGHVLGELHQAARRARQTGRGAAIEELAPLVAIGVGSRGVREPARVQLHLGAGRAQRATQRVIVRGRVGRGVDDVYAHVHGQ